MIPFTARFISGIIMAILVSVFYTMLIVIFAIGFVFLGSDGVKELQKSPYEFWSLYNYVLKGEWPNPFKRY